MASLEERLQRLLLLRPNDGPRSPAKCLALARSFLNLETSWINALGLRSDFYPCVDLAAQLGQTSLPQHVEKAFNESGFAQSTAESVACRNYLRWCNLELENPQAISTVGLDDPFVPLIELFKEGAEFSVEGWTFDVLKCGGINVRALRKKTLTD